MQATTIQRPTDPALLRKSAVLGGSAAVAYFAVVFLVFGAWVHYYYAGSYSGPLWISTFFGISDKSVEAGASVVFKAPVAGWDGQFYYTQSNDPFLLDDYKNSTLIDSTSYRYQRNGLPLLAWTTAKLSGSKRTTPLIYFVTQIGIVSIGFGFLVAFLKMHQVNPAWACVWGFYGGVLRPMSHGLPDPTADALLLMCCMAVLSRRLWIYAMLGSLLCLCRESYAAPAAAIWLLTLFHKLQWNQRFAWWQRVIATALPGVVVLMWAFYVAHQTQTAVLSGSRSIPWGGLVDWPFKAYLQCVWADIKSSDEHDAIYATSCAFCLLVVSISVAIKARRSPELVALLPHILLMTMTGWIVWEAGVGFFKNTSSVVMLGTLMLAFVPSKTLRIALVFTLLASLHYIYRADIRHQHFLPPLTVSKSVEDEKMPKTMVPIDDTFRMACQVDYVSNETNEPTYQGIFRWFHREPRNYTVRITNTSDVLWPASIPGSKVVAVGVQFKKGKMVLHEERLPLYKDMPPGESIEITFAVPYSPYGSKNRIARVSMIQDSRSWFFKDDESLKLDIPY